MHFICRIYRTLATTTIICNWPKGLGKLQSCLVLVTPLPLHVVKGSMIRKKSPSISFWSHAGLKPFYLIRIINQSTISFITIQQALPPAKVVPSLVSDQIPGVQPPMLVVEGYSDGQSTSILAFHCNSTCYSTSSGGLADVMLRQLTYLI